MSQSPRRRCSSPAPSSWRLAPSSWRLTPSSWRLTPSWCWLKLCCIWLAAAVFSRTPLAAADTALGSSTLDAAQSSAKLERYTLENGLVLVTLEDPTATSTALCITYKVGASHEPEARAGLARLLGRLYFQGSRNIPQGDHYRLIAGHGGETHSRIDRETSQYCNTIPSKALAVGLWLEADRMATLSVDDAQFAKQRQLFQDEYDGDVNDSDFAATERLRQLVFLGSFADAHSEWGTEQTRSTLSLAQAREFHWRYYAPRNAVVAVAGNITAAQVVPLVEQHFGKLAPRPFSADVSAIEAPLPQQSTERLSILLSHTRRTPTVLFGWRVPKAGTKPERALRLALAVLASGESSRLHASLVQERASVLAVETLRLEHKTSSLLGLKLVIAPLSSVDRAQEVLDGELKRMRLLGPSASEVSKAKESLRAHARRLASNNLGRAMLLGRTSLLHGLAPARLGPATQNIASPSDLTLEAVRSGHDEFDDISPDDIRSAASAYLTDHLRSIVEVYPRGWSQDEAPEIVVRKHVVKRGETLEHIARIYGSSVDEIARFNKLNPKKPIIVGQVLTIRTASGGNRGGGAAGRASAGPKLYVVKAGDNLIRIAQQQRVTVAELAAANNLDPKKAIIVGRSLKIPERDPEDEAHPGNQKVPGRQQDGAGKGKGQAATSPTPRSREGKKPAAPLPPKSKAVPRSAPPAKAGGPAPRNP